MRSRMMRTVLGVVSAAGLLCLPIPAEAQPSADEILTSVGLSADDKQRVLNGEFVTADANAVSDRDLAVSMAFLVKTSPDVLSRQVVAGSLITSDAQVQSYSMFRNPGSLADLAGLRIPSDEAKALFGAKAGSALNLSAAEIAAFNAVPGGSQQAVQQQLQQMLLRRYQAYRASGLGGIAPYARGGGSDKDLAADLRKATEAAQNLEKYLPKFHAVLLDYPKGMAPEVQENFFWLRSIIHGKPTYVLQQTLAVADGAARAVAQRQFYVSTGYNGEQAVAGFLPVPGGTLVVYSSHAFTDQVSGFGGSMKRSIGSRVMADQLKKMFEAGRTKAAQ
jgi:hypothetical protein